MPTRHEARKQRLAPLVLAAGFAATGCGDIGAIEVDVTFPSEDLELRTRALQVVVRAVPEDGSSGCAALWARPLPGLSETVEVTAYPNRNDVLAAAVSLDYAALTLLIYGHPGIRAVDTTDPATGESRAAFEAVGDPIVGGCVDQPIRDRSATQRVEIPLFPAGTPVP